MPFCSECGQRLSENSVFCVGCGVALDDFSRPDRAPDSDQGDQVKSRKVGWSRGLKWVGDAFALFRNAPMVSVIVTLVFLIILLLMNLVPILGQIAFIFLAPVFASGFMSGCRALDQGEELEIWHLFTGFQKNIKELLVIGLILMAVAVVIGTVAFAVSSVFALLGTGVGMLGGGGGNGYSSGALDGIFLGSLLMIAVFFVAQVIFTMTCIYSVLLITFDDIGAMSAMKLAFRATRKNVGAFVVFWVLSSLLALMVGIVSLGVGLLALIPILAFTGYTSYRDVFLSNAIQNR